MVRPEVLWNWLLQLAENYCEWHPDHLSAYWKKGEPNQIGSIMYFEENIKGEFLKFDFKLTQLVPNKFYEFKTLGTLKYIMPKGTFEIIPSEKGCIFTATLDFRMGKLLSKIAKKSMNKIIQHMQEEGENLKKILESR